MDYKGELFYMVVRVFQRSGQMNHSVEYKTEYEEAQKRFYGIIAADLANNDITYQAAYIINGTGRTIDVKVFDRRPNRPEPNIVVEPEEETEE